MITASVKYTIRQTLAQYEHEELTVEISNDQDNPKSGEEMMKEARRIAVSHTTKALKKKGEKHGNDVQENG